MGATITRNKLPARFQTELNQLLPQLKWSVSEQELIAKVEKLIADFLAKKGGKQDHIDWLLFCSVCNPEIVHQVDDLVDKNPQNNKTGQGIKEKSKKIEEFMKKVEKSMQEEEWKKLEEEVEEEFYKQIAISPDPNWNPGSQGPNQPGQPSPNQNDNSAKITQLQQEINSLKQEVQNLKNSTDSPNSDLLRDKEDKLREKEEELEELKRKNNFPKQNQPDKNNDSNLSLKIGLGVAAVIIVALVAWLVIEKKKKKNINSL
ncbi:protein of unknown function [endosymbiont DhMRE of Dentiscutata heterogama]|uniref:hypothetical protein n=1 Tax=endosymbiont DhMRE of Dentiscutata heterogama TaxID=1609546 RepID=UPI000629D673|nr:hypothetical protein [endosymbiont DhMRE of Dentiscutata heterogama]CFW93011.1 protein of unknown function [endosymbiont DhMRE of Dentiscutata heterogama]